MVETWLIRLNECKLVSILSGRVLWYDICLFLQVSKAVWYSISGLYSGIFAIYLQYHAAQKNTDKAKNILFYALSVLYALSMAAIIIIIWDYCINVVRVITDAWWSWY